jgi:urea transporter
MKVKILAKDILGKTFEAYAKVLFLKNKSFGCVLCFTTFFNLNIATCGLIATILSITFEKIVKRVSPNEKQSFYHYNQLLVGLSIGYLFSIDVAVFILLVISSLSTIVVALMLEKYFSFIGLPILSMPFNIVTTLIYLGRKSFGGLFDLSLYEHNFVGFNWARLGHIDSILNSSSLIFYNDGPLLGAVIIIGLFLISPLACFLFCMGTGFGILIEFLLKGSLSDITQAPYLFNYSLSALAIGGVFLIPSRLSLLIGLITVSITTIISFAIGSFWTLYQIPIFALPFNISVLLVLNALKVLNFKKVTVVFGTTPENTLLQYNNFVLKINQGVPILDFVQPGEWNIYQGFNGEWTHKGPWRFALDFVKNTVDSYRLGDQELSEDTCYGEKVFSPINGTIIQLENTIHDNRPGQINQLKNWGNYIMIQSLDGFIVKLCHLKMSSICVQVNDYVYKGQEIALCGNSGLSPFSHLHLQVQKSPFIGSQTYPFCLRFYCVDHELKFSCIPKKSETILFPQINQIANKWCHLILGERFTIEDVHTSEKIHCEVQLNEDSGQLFISDRLGNRLYFIQEEHQFLYTEFSGRSGSILQCYYLAAPRVPFVFGQKFNWVERFVDQGVVYSSKLSAHMGGIFELLSGKSKKSFGRYTIDETGLNISGMVEVKGEKVKTEFYLSPISGPNRFRYDSRSFAILRQTEHIGLISQHDIEEELSG